jgi:hypothetical protein
MTAPAQYVEGIEHSAQILEAAGYDLVPLLGPLAKSWDLLGVSPHGLILVSVVRGAWPELLGLQSLGVPPRWPAATVRLIHRYADESTWPAVRVL